MIQGVMGVDLGSTRSVISVAKKGHVEVITNDASNRENPAVVGYGQYERFIGEQGQAQKISNFRNTVSNFNRFLGLTPDCPFLEQEKRYISVNLANSSDNSTVAFEVNYKGEKRHFTPVQVMASYLQKIKQIVLKNGISNNEYVLSVPSYYTEQERKALLDACKIAELNNLRLFNENAAIALGYGIFRRSELDPVNVKNVVFVDFGHAKTSAFCASFTKEKFKILAQSDERNLGARDIDWILAEYFSKKFNDEHQVGLPINQHKPRLRLLEAIEKLRKTLSANQEAQINCEYLIEDCDLSAMLTREQFEQFIEPVMQRLTDVLTKLRDEMIQKKILIQDVEIVGGATRIPYVQRVIQQVFGVKDLCRTLNASETISRGCVMMCAMNSSFFQVAHYGCEEYNANPIRCQWIFMDPQHKNKTYHYLGLDVEQNERNNLEKQRAILFDKGCSIPNVKSLTFQRNEPIQLSLYYDNPPAGAQQLLANFIIHPHKTNVTEHSTKIRVKLNQNQLVQIEEAHFEETTYIEVPVEVKTNPATTTQTQQQTGTEQNSEQKPEQQAQQAQQHTEMQKKKQVKTHNLTVDSSHLYSLNEKQLTQFFEQEADMTNQDKVTQEIYERKNYLESYIYSLKHNIQEKYTQFTTPDVAQQILQQLQVDENWLYDEGRTAGKSAFQKKIDALKKLADPIEKRFNEFNNFPEQKTVLLQTLNKYCQQVGTIEHLTEQDRNTVLNEANNIKQWLDNCEQQQKNLPLTLDPVVTCADLVKKQNDFVNLSTPIVNKPKPQPPKQEQPKPEQQQQQKQEETKMETESNQQEQQQQQQGEKMDIE